MPLVKKPISKFNSIQFYLLYSANATLAQTKALSQVVQQETIEMTILSFKPIVTQSIAYINARNTTLMQK